MRVALFWFHIWAMNVEFCLCPTLCNYHYHTLLVSFLRSFLFALRFVVVFPSSCTLVHSWFSLALNNSLGSYKHTFKLIIYWTKNKILSWLSGWCRVILLKNNVSAILAWPSSGSGGVRRVSPRVVLYMLRALCEGLSVVEAFRQSGAPSHYSLRRGGGGRTLLSRSVSPVRCGLPCDLEQALPGGGEV